MKKANTTSNDQAYMRVLKQLRKLIATEYKDGGRFPASREMCKRMNVNRLTYSKALACLLRDGSARNYHQKGIYIVPDKFRCHKVGIILGKGEDSPFVGNGFFLNQVFDELNKYGLMAQLIQASPIENLWRKALHHGVNSLLWFVPPGMPHFSIAKQIYKSKNLPIVIVANYDPANDNHIDYGNVPHFTGDYKQLGKCRADFFIKRKHRNIIFLGEMWFGKYIGFIDNLKKAGISVNDNNFFNNKKNVEKKLAEYIVKEKVTAIFSEGGIDRIEDLFRVISSMSGDYPQPEIIVRDAGNIDILQESYPKVKLTGLEETTNHQCGGQAAEMLARHLTKGEKLKSLLVPYNYNISLT